MPEPASILLVEDTPELREDLAIELEDAGYHVIEAGDGRTAISAFAKESPDLIICDIQLPDIDGISVLEELRQSDKGKVPGIIVSAFSDSALQAKANSVGVVSFLVKPIDYDKLIALVEATIARRP